MFHTEALFFIDYEKSKILKLHVLRQKSVCTDNQIDLPLFQPVQSLFILRITSEAGHHIDLKREVFKTFLQSVIMLICQNCGRNQNSCLLAVSYTLKERTRCNFSLAEAHISAKQTVHTKRTLHVLFNFLNGTELVVCFLIRETVFKLFLPYGIQTEAVSLLHLTLRIQVNQILRHDSDSSLGLGLRRLPFTAGQLIHLRCRAFVANVLLDNIHLLHRHIQHVITGILNLNIVFLVSLDS